MFKKFLAYALLSLCIVLIAMLFRSMKYHEEMRKLIEIREIAKGGGDIDKHYDFVVSCTSSDNRFVRRKAIRALGAFDDKVDEIMEFSLSTLESDDMFDQRVAAEAICEMADQNNHYVDEIIEMVVEDRLGIDSKMFLIKALGRIGPPAVDSCAILSKYSDDRITGSSAKEARDSIGCGALESIETGESSGVRPAL